MGISRGERRVLLDQNAPRRLIAALPTFEVATARRMGWSDLSNGDLIDAAERAGFDVLLTADLNLRHQQNLAGRRIGIVVLPTNRWTTVQTHLPDIAKALRSATPGSISGVGFVRR